MRQRVMTAKCIDIQKQPISRFRYETYKVQNFSMIKKKRGYLFGSEDVIFIVFKIIEASFTTCKNYTEESEDNSTQIRR